MRMIWGKRKNFHSESSTTRIVLLIVRRKIIRNQAGYAELIFRSFSHDELEKYQKYGCHVLGMVHKIDKEMSVKNYFEEYNPEVKRQTPNHLIDYFWIAEEQMEKKESCL